MNFPFSCCESLKTSSLEREAPSQQKRRDTKVKFENINISTFLFDLKKVKRAAKLLRFPWNCFLRFHESRKNWNYHLGPKKILWQHNLFLMFLCGVPSILIFTLYALDEGLMTSKSDSSKYICCETLFHEQHKNVKLGKDQNNRTLFW